MADKKYKNWADYEEKNGILDTVSDIEKIGFKEASKNRLDGDGERHFWRTLWEYVLLKNQNAWDNEKGCPKWKKKELPVI
jgi:hypothetical protein